jgi:PAS domain-containing protein
VAHVELSLTDPAVAPRPHLARECSGLERWASVAVDAGDPCLVLDADAVVVAVSPSAAELTGIPDPVGAQGRRLRDAMAPLLDFTAAAAPLEELEADRIPPLLAISSGLMARGLIRIAGRPGDHPVTLDAISTPLSNGLAVAGSLTFFAKI